MKIVLCENFNLEIIEDEYLTNVTKVNHYKLFFLGELPSVIENEDIKNKLCKILSTIKGIFFTEIMANYYELSKILQEVGFKFLCGSMGWVSTKNNDAKNLSKCRIINISDFGYYSKRISEIAMSFDTSHYESFHFYKPFVRKMYQDKFLSQWEKNEEIIVYFKEENPIAVTTFSVSNDEGWLLSSCVDYPYRGTRAYYAMIEFGQDYLFKVKKVRKIKLECLSSNIVVQKTWNKFGFKPSYSTNIFYKGDIN